MTPAIVALIAAVRAESADRISRLNDGVGTIARDADGHAYDPAVVMRNAAIAALEQKP